MKRTLHLLVAFLLFPAITSAAVPPPKKQPAAEKAIDKPRRESEPANLSKQRKSIVANDDDTPVQKHPGPIVVGPPTELRMSKASGHRFDLRSLPFVPPQKFERPEREQPAVNPTGSLSLTVPPSPNAPTVPQPSAPAPAPLANFDGLDFANWGAGHPPDPNGDVGPTYYIQTINTSIGVFRKSDGARVAAFTFNTFMSQGNFGNLCDTDNFGDPVVLYDTFEDRWIISDFAFRLDGSNNVINPPGSFQCFAVSMSGDPVSGGWNFYSINTTGGLGDYPKLGIWPDGLYMSVNMFGYPNGAPFQDTRLYALNKAQMYAGSPTVKVVSFDLPSDQFTVLPANARLQTGTPPPGSPNYFASVWNFLNSAQIWKFHVDWNNIPLSSVTGPFDAVMPFWWEQFNRSGTTTAPTPANFLDSLYPRLMVQNQYSNIAGTESLWDAHTVGAGNPTSNVTSNLSAVRYYQINVTGGNVASNMLQSFTYSPDTLYRYMPSVAVNRSGDMAIGYTTSNATTNPAMVYAGRLHGDAANSITQTEQLLFQGTGSQSGTCGTTCIRWGDYSAMTLDPNGCTFWYTNEYYITNGLAFNTRIGSFSFPSCTPVGVGGTVQGTVVATAGGAPISGATINLGARTTTTDSSGVYAFTAIPAGVYPTITASYPGYSPSTSTGVSVTDGGTTTENFSLSSASSGSCLVDTTQADFNGGVQTNLDVTSSPGDVKLSSPNILDQQNATVSPTGFGISTTTWAGQTFTPAVSGQLVRADIELFCAGCTATSPNITVSIRATTGATPVPTGADLATATLPGFNDGGAGGLKTVTFATPLTVTAGTRYAVIFRNSAAFANGTVAYTCSCITTGFTDSNPYTLGQRVASTNSGATWTADTTVGGRDLNFRIYINAGFAPSGNLVSSIKDSNPPVGNAPNWSTLSWTASTPANTSLQFQVAGSNNVNGPFNFVGPDGTAATFFTTSGASIAQFNGLRYLEYKALLGTTNGTVTPTLSDVTTCFADVPCSPTGPAITPSNTTVCPNATGITASLPAGSSNDSWSITNGTITGGAGTNAITFTAGASGTVDLQVTLTDATGCVQVSTFSIPIDTPAKPTITPGGPTTFCSPGSVTLTSSASSGNQWSLNGVPIGGATNQTLIASASGSYTVSYVDANGCLSPTSDPTSVTVNALPVATITISNTQSVNVSGTGTFTLTFNGATTSPIATSATAAAVQAALNALPTIGGVGGSVVVTQSSSVYTITFGGTLTGPQPEMSSSASAGVNAAVTAAGVCPSSTGNQASAPGGLTYAWSITNGTITSATNVQTVTYTANASGDAILNLTVTDGNGCSSSAAPADVPLFAPPAAPAIIATTNGTGTTDQACPEQPLTLTATGTPGAVSYQWYQDNAPINGATASTYQATGAATYYVTETDSNGCTSAQSAGYVVQNPTPHSAFITADGSMICAGGSVHLTSDSATGIQWYKDGVPIPGATSQDYVATAAGTYTAILDALGCHSAVSNSITLPASANPAPDATITSPATVLVNSSNNAASVPDAGAGATYSWSAIAGTITSGGGTRNVTFRLNATGTHAVSVTVTTPTGCTSFGSVNVSSVNTMTATHFSVATPAVVTNGAPFTAVVTALDATNSPVTNYAGTIHFTSSSAGTLPADYTFTGAPNNGSQSFSVTLTTNGAQSLSVSDGTNSGSANMTVVCPALSVTASAAGPTTFCAGGSVTLNSSSATGNQWYLNGNPIAGATGSSYSATASGNYTVTMTDANGCMSPASNAIAVSVTPLPPTPTITAGAPTAFCAGGSVTLTSSAATGNQWYLNGSPIGGAVQSTYVANAAGDYTVISTASGCSSAASAATTVTVNANPNATITVPSSVASSSTGNIASVANAGAGATYNWSITNGTITAGTGTPSITFTAGAIGTLTLQVTVTTASSCSDTKSANVTVGAPAVSVTAVAPTSGTSFGGTNVTVTGSGFAAGATLTFGGTAATNVVVVNATTITATTSPHAAGAVNVVVTNTNSATATLTNGFTYIAQRFDPNADQTIDPSDIFYLVNYLFLAGPAPHGTAGLMSGDANGDNIVDPADIFYAVNYLFDGGPRPSSIATTPQSARGLLAGSITLGQPFVRDGRTFVPVIVTASKGAAPAQALSLRLRTSDDLRIVAIHRTATADPRFEITRTLPDGAAYLLSVAEPLAGIVAEIEVANVVDATLTLDPALTMLADRSGNDEATVSNGRLQLGGATIGRDRAPKEKDGRQ